MFYFSMDPYDIDMFPNYFLPYIVQIFVPCSLSLIIPFMLLWARNDIAKLLINCIWLKIRLTLTYFQYN